MKTLVDLPAELVRTVLHTLDPESFYLCLLTSKLFREHALASTSLLRDQLSRIPGLRNPSSKDTGNATDLIREFGKRAAKHLRGGVPWMTDVHIWRTSSEVDRKNSILIPLLPNEDCKWDDTDLNYLALVEIYRKDASIHLYLIRQDVQGAHYPRLKYIISTDFLYEHFPSTDGQLSEYEVLKVAPYVSTKIALEPKLAVLYRKKLRASTGNAAWVKLLIFKLDPQFGPLVEEIFDIEAFKNEQIVALAISSYCEPVILHRYDDDGMDSIKLVAYAIEQDDLTCERRTVEKCSITSPAVRYPNERIAGLSIHGRTIDLYPSTFPIPHWTVPWLSNMRDHIERRDTTLPDTIEVFIKQSLGRAIAHCHHHLLQETDLNDGEETCVNTALELMISRDDSCGLNYRGVNSRSGAYILKAIHYPSTCIPFDLEKDYHTLHHVFIAQLAGLPDLDNLSTLGLKLAVSRYAHRIAMASWKTIKVWSLDPKAFLDPEYSLNGAEGVPGDYAYIEGCGWQYYENGRFEKECVVLDPVELPSVGVVYGLEFQGEDELWGWCEPGLVRWRFDVHGKGEKVVSVLE